MAQQRIESWAGVMKLFGLSGVTRETLQRLRVAALFGMRGRRRGQKGGLTELAK